MGERGKWVTQERKKQGNRYAEKVVFGVRVRMSYVCMCSHNVHLVLYIGLM